MEIECLKYVVVMNVWPIASHADCEQEQFCSDG